MFCGIWDKIGENVNFLCISKLGGSNIHETVIFDVIFRILEASSGRWASALSLGNYVFFLYAQF